LTYELTHQCFNGDKTGTKNLLYISPDKVTKTFERKKFTQVTWFRFFII